MPPSKHRDDVFKIHHYNYLIESFGFSCAHFYKSGVTEMPGKGGGTEGAFFSIFGDFVTGRQIELVPNERISQAWRMMDWVSVSIPSFALHYCRKAITQN